jgi:beta-lactam-binding protein with PASTA domain
MIKKNFTNIYIRNLLMVFFIVLTLIFAVLWWLDIYTKHGSQVFVPDVTGLQMTEASPVFKQKKLNYAVVDSFFVKNKPVGSILETMPPIGTKVKEGRTIYITVNSFSDRLLIIPEVKDMSQRQAIAMLKSIGFELITVKMLPAAYKDLVLGLQTNEKTVSSGARLSADTPLTLLVSSGEKESLFFEGDSLLPDNFSDDDY